MCKWGDPQYVGEDYTGGKFDISSHYHKSGNTYNIKMISRLRTEVGCEGDWNGFVILISTI